MAILLLGLKIISVVLIIISLILTAIIFVPFRYIVKGSIDEGFYGNACVKLLFGLVKLIISREKESSKVKMQISLCGINISMADKKKFKTRETKKSEIKEKSSKKIQFNKNLFNILCNYTKEVLNIIKPKYIKADGIYGFEDPSMTGILSGLISIINTAYPNNNINLFPRFEEEVYHIELEIMGKILGFI
ncbi:DUF2953 domain-containing protein, partial [Clostridium neonatale]